MHLNGAKNAARTELVRTRKARRLARFGHDSYCFAIYVALMTPKPPGSRVLHPARQLGAFDLDARGFWHGICYYGSVVLHICIDQLGDSHGTDRRRRSENGEG